MSDVKQQPPVKVEKIENKEKIEKKYASHKQFVSDFLTPFVRKFALAATYAKRHKIANQLVLAMKERLPAIVGLTNAEPSNNTAMPTIGETEGDENELRDEDGDVDGDVDGAEYENKNKNKWRADNSTAEAEKPQGEMCPNSNSQSIVQAENTRRINGEMGSLNTKDTKNSRTIRVKTKAGIVKKLPPLTEKLVYRCLISKALIYTKEQIAEIRKLAVEDPDGFIDQYEIPNIINPEDIPCLATVDIRGKVTFGEDRNPQKFPAFEFRVHDCYEITPVC